MPRCPKHQVYSVITQLYIIHVLKEIQTNCIMLILLDTFVIWSGTRQPCCFPFVIYNDCAAILFQPDATIALSQLLRDSPGNNINLNSHQTWRRYSCSKFSAYNHCTQIVFWSRLSTSLINQDGGQWIHVIARTSYLDQWIRQRFLLTSQWQTAMSCHCQQCYWRLCLLFFVLLPTIYVLITLTFSKKKWRFE